MDQYGKHEFIFVNGNREYLCFAGKVVDRRGYLLLKTLSGNWVVANGVRILAPLCNGRVKGDWEHGNYFLEDRNGAIKFFDALEK